MKNILMTGATGFLGGWLVKHFLANGDKVGAIVNPKTSIRRNNLSQYHIENLNQACTEFAIDITDEGEIRKSIEDFRPDVVIHLAAVGDVTLCAENPDLAFRTSALSTLNLLEGLRKSSPATLFLSHTTDKVYSGNGIPFREDMCLKPAHIYEVAKVAQEHLTECYARQYNLKTITIRCGNYFGGYDFNFSRVVPYSIRQCLAKEPIVLRSDGSFTRDFLYIEAAVLVNQLLIDRHFRDEFEHYGEAFNFSLEVNLSVLDLVKKICRLMNESPEIVINSTVKTEIPDMLLSCDKARKLLNWTPEFNLDEGLLKTIEAYASSPQTLA